jgi:DNA-binding transcriptional LysR family regulator
VNFDLRQIRAFDAVARRGGFSKASQEMDLTQPTLSTHILNLERQLGVKLFDRSGRKVNLTPAGEILAEYAGRIMELCTESLQAIESFKGQICGEVNVDSSTVPGEYILPRWLNYFHLMYPDVMVILTVNDSSQVLEKVVSGEVPIGVTGSPGTHPSLESRRLCDDRIILVSTPDMIPAGKKQKIAVQDLSKLPMIRREPGSGTQIAVEKALRERRMEPNSMTWSATLGSTRAVIEGVLAGLGAAFLSYSAVTREIADGHIGILEVKGLQIQRGFYIVYNPKKTLSPAEDRFCEELLRAGQALLPDIPT